MVKRAGSRLALALVLTQCRGGTQADLPAEALRAAVGEARAAASAKSAQDAGSSDGHAAAGSSDGHAAAGSSDGHAAAGSADGHADAHASARDDASHEPDPGDAPFGVPIALSRGMCAALQREGSGRLFLAPADTRVAFVNGDEALALVNRSPTGALAPDYAPSDLVDVRDGSPRKASECDGRNCLRRDAQAALHRMLDAMRGDGVEGHVQSTFRAFATQCWVFASWAHQARGGFCEATEQSALAGHSQHQLGTTLDLFTKEWADTGAKRGQSVFRNGFGCSRGGKWLDENAWKFGFVVPYPIHPDDRKSGSRCLPRDGAVPIDPQTGYKHEPWHVRFIGVDEAARYHAQWLASGPGTADEITLEQWLRAGRGLVGDAELPVCDGCNCGACATLASEDPKTPCGKASLQLDPVGRAVSPSDPPHIVDARAVHVQAGVVVEVTVHSPAHTPSQTPILGGDGVSYAQGGATYHALKPEPDALPHAYGDLPGAWRVAIEPTPTASIRWPWRASLADAALGATWNRANLVLPAKAGDATVRVPVPLPRGATGFRVALIRDGAAHDERPVALPTP